MTLAQSARDAERHRWRALTQAAIAAAADPMSATLSNRLAIPVAMAKDYVLPTGERAEDLKCVALIHAGRAFVAQPNGERRAVCAGALRACAELVGDLLDATDPAGAPEPPQRRFRADIDG